MQSGETNSFLATDTYSQHDFKEVGGKQEFEQRLHVDKITTNQQFCFGFWEIKIV